MKVLMTTDAVGGVWTYSMDLAAALAARGVQVTLATLGPEADASLRRKAAGIPALDLRRGDFALEWMDDCWDDVDRSGEWLLDIARQVRPDVVHLNGYAHGALPWQAPTVVVGHSCVLSWWRAVKGEDAPPRYDEYRRRVRAGLTSADVVVAPTRAMLGELQRFYGPLGDARVIHNTRRMPPGYDLAPCNEPLILAAGRAWDEAKNVQALLDVAEELPWRVCIAGLEARPAGGNVCPLGWLAPVALRAWMRRAAIFVEPAWYEPFGLSALEAAMAGCCLILGDIPSLREVWGHAAIYVPPGDRPHLRDACLRVIRDEHLRERMARRARHRALRYRPERFASQYLAIYRQFCPHAPAPAAPRWRTASSPTRTPLR